MQSPVRALVLIPFLLLSSPIVQAKPLKVCALYPHLKDSYWLSVNQGMAEQAKLQGVTLKVMEAGGYRNQAVQVSQYQKCQRWGADVVLLGSVSYRLDPAIHSQLGHTPTLAVVNAVEPDSVIATIGVSWYEMGQNLARYINQNLATGAPLETLLMPGPEGRGGNQFLKQGLLDHLQPGKLNIVATLYGGNSVAVQRQLLTDYLADHPAPQLIIGGAVSAEVAINELRSAGLSDTTQIISSYLTHAVYRGLMRNRVLMANSDQMRLQGRLAVDAALRVAGNQPLAALSGPEILSLTQDNGRELIDDSLSDPQFRAVYEVTAEPNR
ncbi:protein TorT [Ferrimonas sediminum]|uniref:Protein TorT n=1 Tax=Ferrimonas sediminum TaxID=718193 RepID=A0A1G8S8M3_9GAMM|nr:TMAO reductase system periplasmic protein TorT [Ferrimonas sediminum]SDJ25531.1 protein TorT [Ferrimonas sediminum]